MHLSIGNLTHESLQTIGHPCIKLKSSGKSWKPPDCGYLQVGSLAFQCLEGWVRDPHCLEKFGYYINNRSTSWDEVTCQPFEPALPCKELIDSAGLRVLSINVASKIYHMPAHYSESRGLRNCHVKKYKLLFPEKK